MSDFDPGWHRELSAGTGRAAGLDAALREALALATTEHAAEEAQRARTAARDEQRRLAEERRERQQALDAERRARARRRIGQAFTWVFPRVLAGAVLVGATPVVASFITVLPFGANLEPVVFFPGETGSVAGSGPFMLYGILLWAGLYAVLAMFVVDLVVGHPGQEPATGAVVGALAGVGYFIWQWVDNTLTGSSWQIAPATLVAGYLVHAVIARVRDERRYAAAR